MDVAVDSQNEKESFFVFIYRKAAGALAVLIGAANILMGIMALEMTFKSILEGNYSPIIVLPVAIIYFLLIRWGLSKMKETGPAFSKKIPLVKRSIIVGISFAVLAYSHFLSSGQFSEPNGVAHIMGSTVVGFVWFVIAVIFCAINNYAYGRKKT